jgi:lysophospholipase L1-like esterase
MRGEIPFVYPQMIRVALFLSLSIAGPLVARELPPLPPSLAAYKLDPAPSTPSLLLKKGDRLAICGDSITEQKLYSALLETYLIACYPELEITCRQHGWSGEQAGGFLARMHSDVLRFKPTIATTCYGMNDFHYVPYDKKAASDYRRNQAAIIAAFKKARCRVVLGSSGIIDSVPGWVKSGGTIRDLNLSLARFRNIGVGLARTEGTAFADIYRPMLLANDTAKQRHGPDFMVAGKDGVHPGWAGHVIMAYGFLKALGIDGNLGGITYDEVTQQASGVRGHEILATQAGKLKIRSTRLPFCPGPGPTDKDDSIRAGLALVPFDDELNRFIFRLTSPQAAAYTVTWGHQKITYTAKQLSRGVNLAKDFTDNPLVPAFKKIWQAVSAKQAYETKQIKELVHGPEGTADLEGTFAKTEKIREPLEKAIIAARFPVEHQITFTAVP